ncbi:FAD/NAD(P)-binding domain-containing protein [Ceraceosorus guamensis]|uniref:Sulfide:quinone oxidoreductase, mitochondrial n=1 Tax=Ceraceosorus guamensis TaxID=1522189 RepID=A0A316VUC3_9BASI|nr:FAD/NAD(P)-binding domain-containing protein [Ceraceosorus guamensis]PWN41092.1 FAD/NAD(P)-binding domain-containing protein [Ceraceosorus guamensis]
MSCALRSTLRLSSGAGAASSIVRSPQSCLIGTSLSPRHTFVKLNRRDPNHVQHARSLASEARSPVAPTSGGHPSHKVVIVGGGSAGQTILHQLWRTGLFAQGDLALLDGSAWHHYQPGWTLVGAGLKTKEELRRPLPELLDDTGATRYARNVVEFKPSQNRVVLEDGIEVAYENLVVCPGVDCKWEKVRGLREALEEKSGRVVSNYSFESVSNVFPAIQSLRSGNAIFTQPLGVVKCPGAPQKAMWLAEDYWRKAGLRSDTGTSAIKVSFATGNPVIFAVPKYAAALNEIRESRNIEMLAQHNLLEVHSSNKASFSVPSKEGEPPRSVTLDFDLLHATPPQGPLDVVAKSPLADQAGFVEVDAATTRHTRFPNIWSAGDASSLPTSKTAAAITAQAPVLVANLVGAMKGGDAALATYDGYTSCPLLTEYGKVMLAEFKYGGQIKETFGNLFGIDQAEPRRAFYHLKKDFFPAVYYGSMVRGTWAGPKGWTFSSPHGASARTTRSLSTFTGRPSAAQQCEATVSRGFATSSARARDMPARRPRDPLANNPHAKRHPLKSGETFIVRPPPTLSSPESVISDDSTNEGPWLPSASGSNAAPSHLPPALPPRTRSAQAARSAESKSLTADEISLIRQLRAEDPIKWTGNQLAKRFGCSPTFIRIIAPAPKEVRQVRKEHEEARKENWGMNKRLSVEGRKARRELW